MKPFAIKSIVQALPTGSLAALLLSACANVPSPNAAIPPAPRCAGDAPHDIDTVARSLGWSSSAVAELEEERHVPHEVLCTLPSRQVTALLMEHEEERPRPDHPAEWAKQNALQQADEYGVVDRLGFAHALVQRQALLERQAQMPRESVKLAGITGSSSWQPLGPGNIGGRVRSMVMVPGSQKLLAGSATGGIWSSTDHGQTWHVTNDFMGSLAIGALTVDPNNSQVLYAGTGEGPTYIYGNGVYKSTDGGNSWSALNGTTPSLTSPTNYGFFWVDRIAVQPGNSNTVIAATNFGVYRSADGGATWTGQYTNDTFHDVRFDPKNTSNVVLGGDRGDIYTSSDAGQTWTRHAIASSGRMETAFAANTSGLVYASGDQNSGTIYKSTDSGATWTTVSNPKHLGDQGWYGNTIWVDPTDASRLIIGGIDLYRSTDGGANWTQISDWTLWPQSAHADHHVLIADTAFDGNNNLTVYNGDDGGVFAATNFTNVTSGANGGWTSLNNALPITQFYSVASNPLGTIVGGAQDNGSLQYQGGQNTWVQFYGGDGGFTAVDPNSANVFYGEYVNLQLFSSLDGGQTANSIYTGISDAKSDTHSLFISPFILDPNDSSRMYAGGSSLWRSDNVTDAVPQWTAVTTVSNGKRISAIAVAKTDPNIVWYGTEDGQLYYSTNALSSTPTWRSVSNTLPSRYVMQIFIDPDSPTKVYVTQGGFKDGNLRYTTDYGNTWTVSSAAGGLPIAPIRTVTRNPSNPSWLYIGGEVGLFTSQDGGVTWSTNTDGPANVQIDQLDWEDSNHLIAATFGRGMYMATIGSPIARYSDNASGTIGNLTLSAAVTPAQADTGIRGAVFVAALLPNGQYYLESPSGWFPFDGGHPAVYTQGPLQATTVPVVTNMNLTSLSGTIVLMGYGRGDTPAVALGDLLKNGQYKIVYYIH